MELKIWHDERRGTGSKFVNDGSGLGYFEQHCQGCGGKGYTNPPQQTLDDLECAEIERELLTKSYRIEYGIWKDLVSVIISMAQFEEYVFSGKTKIEALRNAKERIEQKG